MEKFARIIETPTTQVLYYIDYDTDEDVTVLHQIIRTPEGITADISAHFYGDDQEDRAQFALSRVTQDNALNAVAMVERLINGGTTDAESEHVG